MHVIGSTRVPWWERRHWARCVGFFPHSACFLGSTCFSGPSVVMNEKSFFAEANMSICVCFVYTPWTCLDPPIPCETVYTSIRIYTETEHMT